MKPHHVLILGCGRSGTSIFGELFEHLSDFTYYSEPDFDELENLDFNQAIAIKVPRRSKIYPPDKGLSISLQQLLKVIPQPLQIYWQLRHPLDAICSLKVGISKNWGHHPQPHDWQDWLDEPLVKQCAYHWSYINTFGYKQVSHMAKIKKFEDMLADPKGFAEQVGKEIGLDVDLNKKELKTWSERVQNKNNGKFVEAITSRPYSTQDHSVKVNRWKENLSKEELDMLIPMISNLAQNFGYELP